MIEDVRYAVRQLRKNPGFAAAAVMTLGLGIGAAAAMFGLIQGVLLSPPPFTQPERLVLVSPSRVDGQPYTQGSTIGQWIDWRTSSRTLESPALYRWTFNFLVLPDGSESLGGMVVTGNFFKVLGLTPVLGREFTDTEAGRPKVPPTGIILGYDLWQRKFNGDRGEGGRLIVVGVALGAVVGILFGRALEAHLFEVKAADPISLAAASLAFGTVALGTCLLPALRAARTDLLAALHQD